MFWLFLRAVFGLGLVAVAAFGAGAWIAVVLPSTYRRFERLALALLGGLGILSSALFLVGQVWLTPFSIGSTLAAGIALAFASFHKIFSNRVHLRPEIGAQTPSRDHWQSPGDYSSFRPRRRDRGLERRCCGLPSAWAKSVA